MFLRIDGIAEHPQSRQDSNLQPAENSGSRRQFPGSRSFAYMESRHPLAYGFRMQWTTTSFLIQVFAGFAGAHAAAAVVREHAFGFWGHTAVGLVAGAVGGYFLQTYAATVVMGNGALNVPRPADIYFLQAAAGATLGGIAMMAIGMIVTPHKPQGD